ELIIDYFELVTDVSDEEIAELGEQMASNSINPMILKKRLASEIVTDFHDSGAAQRAEGHFESTVQKKEIPDDIIEVSISKLRELLSESQESMLDSLEKGNAATEDDIMETFLMSGVESETYDLSIPFILEKLDLVKSKGEARRLIKQKGIQIIHADGSKLIVFEDRNAIQPGDTIKVGKRRWLKIIAPE
ncbi:unnamed protein product, partial [marine sediment metagenome]